MAIYHFTAKTGSRAGGHSASAKDEYIEREGRYEGDASELEHSESSNMPEWAEDDAHSYWEAADEHERANGRLFREVEFALPVELDERQAAGTGPRVRPIADPRGAAALHAGDPPGRGDESALPPDDIGAGQRWVGPDAGDLVQAVQREAAGAGRALGNRRRPGPRNGWS